MEKTREKNQIRTERERAGLTLERLSIETNIPVSTLSRYQDSDNVPFAAMQKIADVLNLPVSALMSKREIPEGDRLTYDQVNLQLQATQQQNIYLATLCDGQRRTNRLLRMIAVVLAVFLVYVIVDRFLFPGQGLFRAG